MSNGAIVLGRERDLLPLFQGRTEELQRRMANEGIDLVLLTNVDSIYYYTAYWGDLGLEFGRPTMVAVAAGGEVTLITAESESLMARAMTWVEDLETFSDGVGNEWRDPLDKVLGSRAGRIALAVERTDIPAVISDYLRSGHGISEPVDATPVIARMRMVKSAEELDMIRQAGQVAVAMGKGGREVIAEGVPEYEVSLACIVAGTRKAAEIIGSEDAASLMSPMIHNLQVLQSGHFTSYTHLHPTVRRIQRGDPVYMCFCPIAHFKQFKLGLRPGVLRRRGEGRDRPHLRDRDCRPDGRDRGDASRRDRRGRARRRGRGLPRRRLQPLLPHRPRHRPFVFGAPGTEDRRPYEARARNGLCGRRRRHGAGCLRRPGG